jgi:thiamine kinase-like enzyme
MQIENLKSFPDWEILEDPIGNLFFQLNQEEFKNAQKLKLAEEYTEGKTSSRVFLAEVVESSRAGHHPPIIVKVGKSSMLRNEIQRFLSIYPSIKRSGLFAKIIEPDKCLKSLPEDQSMRAIAYTYTKDQQAGLECCGLEHMCREFIKGELKWEDLQKVFKKVFEALTRFDTDPGELTGDPIAQYYLYRWAPNFSIKADAYFWIRKSKQHLFTAKKYKETYFAKEKKSTARKLIRESENHYSELGDVAIEGLKYREHWEKKLFLWAHRATTLHLQLDISELNDNDKDEAIKKISHKKAPGAAVFTPRGTSRHTFYMERLKEAFPNIDFRVEAFNLGRKPVRNPMRRLPRPWDEDFQPETVKMVPAHGDLHPGNILVVDGAPTFFDYGLSEPSLPIGIDMVRLMGALFMKTAATLMDFEHLKTVFLTAFDLADGQHAFFSDTQQRTVKLLALLKSLTLEHMDEKTFRLHLYGFAWTGLKWDWDSPVEKQAAHRAAFLMAAAAYTRIVGPPEEQDNAPLLKVRGAAGPGEETAGLPSGHPIHKDLDEWVTGLEKEHQAAAAMAGLHGKEYRRAMVKLLDRLHQKGLAIKSNDLPLVLAAFHLNGIALWVSSRVQDLRLKCGEYSAAFVHGRHKELMAMGLDQGDCIALENILNAFPAYQTEAVDERVLAVSALLCLCYALAWGDERLPDPETMRQMGLEFKARNAYRWQWARHLSAASPVTGNCLSIENKQGALHLIVTPVVKTVFPKAGERIADELTAWPRYLLEKSMLPDLLRRHWRLNLLLQPAEIKRKQFVRRGKLDAGGILNEIVSQRERHKETDSGLFLLPGVLEAKPLAQSKKPDPVFPGSHGKTLTRPPHDGVVGVLRRRQRQKHRVNAYGV